MHAVQESYRTQIGRYSFAENLIILSKMKKKAISMPAGESVIVAAFARKICTIKRVKISPEFV
jgi:hypothetical protein